MMQPQLLETQMEHGANQIPNQQPTNTANTDNQQPPENGIPNSIPPSAEDCALTPEDNLEPNPAGLKNSRTGGLWHKSLEEPYSAQVKEKSLLGHLMCSEETQKRF